MTTDDDARYDAELEDLLQNGMPLRQIPRAVRLSVAEQMKAIADLLKLYVENPGALDQPTRVFLAMNMANLGTFLVGDASFIRRGE